jgi:hypothetical protein
VKDRQKCQRPTYSKSGSNRVASFPVWQAIKTEIVIPPPSARLKALKTSKWYQIEGKVDENEQKIIVILSTGDVILNLKRPLAVVAFDIPP